MTICLEDLNIIGGGNDFAVDDVFLREICKYTDEVTITVLNEITAQQDYEICFGESVTVGGQSFDDAGDYDVVLQSFQGCDSTINVHVEVAVIEAYIVPPEPLNCYFTETSLDGSLSVGSNGINSFFWTTTGGVILSNPQSGSVTIGSGGLYQLLVSTQLGSITCFDSVSLFVPQDTVAPISQHSRSTLPFLPGFYPAITRSRTTASERVRHFLVITQWHHPLRSGLPQLPSFSGPGCISSPSPISTMAASVWIPPSSWPTPPNPSSCHRLYPD